jgi:hypothetical protein
MSVGELCSFCLGSCPAGAHDKVAIVLLEELTG